jgi:ATP-dependent exoDNAse (exonuclease V) beta subunit
VKVRVASAGTGKTTRLVARFLTRIGEGVPLRRLAGVTFTRSAAAELRERVGEGLREIQAEGAYLGGLVVAPDGAEPRYREALRELDGATLATIHGFMALGLRLSAPILGLDPDFGTLPEWEAQVTFEEELEGLTMVAADPEHPLHAPLARVGERGVEAAVEVFRRRSLAERVEPATGDAEAADVLALYGAAYRRFEARTGASRLAPSEIERRALALVRSPQALARLAERSPYVVVDEFQDVNPLQGRFFAALEAGGVEVEVVGDPKQSIYGFRHADVEVFRTALATGEVLPPLTESRRHARLIVRFLNALTRESSERGWGFGRDEAPDVVGAGPQAEVQGRIEIHWVHGGSRIGDLRPTEAEVLAERLLAAHERGRPWREMAVLARAHHGLERVRAALRARGVPAVLRQGRGYYERSEIRDLVTALKVGIEPERGALAAWLRGPFGGLDPGAIDALLRAKDPLALLSEEHADVAARLRRTRDAVRGTPLEALRTLVRAPMIDGHRFVELLSQRQRENVDALLFEVAERPPGELEVLLERLDLLSRQAKEAGDVPAAGEGVTLITVHGSKGLEWPLVAVHDLGASERFREQPLFLEDGRLHLPGGPSWPAARTAAADRDRQESYRLLYVAASRARDELILTGSVTDRGPEGWARVLEAMRLAPGERERDRDDFVLRVHPPRPVETSGADAEEEAAPGLPEAPWTRRRFEPGALPPVESPSRVRGAAEPSRALRGPRSSAESRGAPDPAHGRAPDDGRPSGPDDAAEPLRPGEAAEAGRLPGQAVAVGTLLHDAIRRDAHPGDDAEMELLRAQEVMFPYAREEQDRLLDEVRAMLGVYHELLGRDLPALGARDRDLREWPVLLPDGPQTWQGVIDRLYLAGGVWYLDDYKTDRTMRQERYAFQLAVYRETVRRALRVDPVARLVNLRDGAVVAVEDGELEAAWASRGDALEHDRA